MSVYNRLQKIPVLLSLLLLLAGLFSVYLLSSTIFKRLFTDAVSGVLPILLKKAWNKCSLFVFPEQAAVFHQGTNLVWGTSFNICDFASRSCSLGWKGQTDRRTDMTSGCRSLEAATLKILWLKIGKLIGWYQNLQPLASSRVSSLLFLALLV